MKKIILGVLAISFMLFTGCGEKEKTINELLTSNKDIKNIYFECESNYFFKDSKSSDKEWITEKVIKQENTPNGMPTAINYVDKVNMEFITYKDGEKNGNKMKIKQEEIKLFNPYTSIAATIEADLDKFKKAKDEKVDGKDCYVYEGSSDKIKNQTLIQKGYKEINYKIYFLKENDIICKYESKAGKDKISSMIFKNIRLGNIKDDEVKIIIPEDVKLIETKN